MIKGHQDMSDMGDVIVWHENVEFKRDFFEFITERWKEEKKKKDLYLVIQYAELKEGVQPSIGGQISRKLIEDEYDLVGYSCIKMNDDVGRFAFGQYTVPLYDGPVYVEECLPDKKNNRTIKVSIDKIGQKVHPLPPPKPTLDIPPEKQKEID